MFLPVAFSDCLPTTSPDLALEYIKKFIPEHKEELFNAINNNNINNTIQQHDNHSIKFLNLGLNNSFSNFLETTENKQNNNFEQIVDCFFEDLNL